MKNDALKNVRYYNLAQEEILIKRKQIKEFISVPKLLGDFYEEIIRDYLKAHIPPQFKVTRGVASNPRQNITSSECDIIIYDSAKWISQFKTENMAIVPTYCIRTIIEIKSMLNSQSVKRAKETFQSVLELDNTLPCFLIGFETGRKLESLNEMLGKDGKTFVFSKRNGDIIPDQLAIFMQHLRSKLLPDL